MILLTIHFKKPACGTPVITLGDYNKALQAQFECSPCLKKVCAYNKPSLVEPACYQTLPAQSVLDKLQALMA